MLAAALLLFPLIGVRITLLDTACRLVLLRQPVGDLPPARLRAPGVPHPFSVLWSLAVEEHFYLVFPLLVLFLARRQAAFLLAMLGLIAAVTLWRVHMAGACAGGCTILRIEHGTDTRIDSILYGAVLATLLASKFRAPTLRLVTAWYAAPAGLGLVLASLLIRDPWFRQTLRFNLQGAGLFLLIGAILYAPRLGAIRSLLERPLALRIGRLSYSLYLWHWVVLCSATALLPAWAAAPLIDSAPSASWFALVFGPLLAAAFALAAASYYGVERPMLRLRRAFGSHAVADQPLSADRPRYPAPTNPSAGLTPTRDAARPARCRPAIPQPDSTAPRTPTCLAPLPAGPWPSSLGPLVQPVQRRLERAGSRRTPPPHPHPR